MKITCPDCKHDFSVLPAARYDDRSQLTVEYRMKEGHMMPVRDFAKSITGLADGLILTAKHLGAPKVDVFITGLQVSESSVKITVQTVLVSKAKVEAGIGDGQSL